jgi:hypothetical protein
MTPEQGAGMTAMIVIGQELPAPDAVCVATRDRIVLVVDPRIPVRTLAAIIAHRLDMASSAIEAGQTPGGAS